MAEGSISWVRSEGTKLGFPIRILLDPVRFNIQSRSLKWNADFSANKWKINCKSLLYFDLYVIKNNKNSVYSFNFKLISVQLSQEHRLKKCHQQSIWLNISQQVNWEQVSNVMWSVPERRPRSVCRVGKLCERLIGQTVQAVYRCQNAEVYRIISGNSEKSCKHGVQQIT